MNTSKAKTILVTGASGFIGTHTVPFLQEYFDVRKYSLRNGDKISSNILAGVDTIVYLTGIAHQLKKIDSSLYYTINKDLAVSLALEAKQAGVSQFIYISSIKAIGEGGKGVFKEGEVCKPQTDYGKSKLQAEEELLKIARDHFVVSVIRPAVVYGKGAKGNIDKLIRLIEKLPIIPLGGIENKRSMVYIGNFLALLKKVIDTRTQGIFVAADPKVVSTSDMVNEINTLIPVSKKITHLPGFILKFIKILNPDLHAKLFGDFEVENTLTNQRLNFTPPYSFEAGMHEMMGMKESIQNKRTDVSV